MGLAHFDNMESNKYIDDYRSFMLRESFAQNFKLVEYDDMKQQLEELLKSYSDVVIDSSVDIEEGLYIRLDMEIEKSKRIKKLYNDFIKLLKFNQYYIMSCKDENYIKIQMSYNIFKTNRFIRLFLDKIYDIPMELKDVRYLYHVTLKENYPDIKLHGLKTSDEGMVSDEPFKKVYMFKDKSGFLDFAYDKKRHLKEKNILIDEYILLRIDIRSIDSKLYKDRKETQREAYYTKEPVPYWSICKIDEIVI